MRALSRMLGGVLFGALLSLPALAAPQPLPTIWFHSQSPSSGVATDWIHLWDTPNNGWPRAAAHTKAYVFGDQAVLKSTTADLKKALKFLRANSISVGMVWEGVYYPGTNGCGTGWPTFHASNNTNVIAAFQAAGDHPDFLQMDEPLQNAHYLASKHNQGVGCQYSIKQTAQLAVPQLKQMQAAFPKVQFIDVETFGLFPSESSNWQADVAAWKSDWQSATGSPFPAMLDDNQWGSGPPDGPDWVFLKQLETAVHPVPFGVLFDGLGQAQPGSDYNWMQACEQNMSDYTANMAPPDVAEVTSFQNWPSLALPETDNTRLTAAIDYYMSLFGW